MIMPGRGAISAAVLVLAIGLTACSSSGSGSTPSSTSHPAAPSTFIQASDPPVPPSGPGSPADPGTKRAVAQAYSTFFSGASSTAQSMAVLQHGSSFAAALTAQSKDPYSHKSGVKVSSVGVTGDLAFVKFSVTSNGQEVLRDFPGYAVQEAGKWRVAALTFCTLLKLQGSAPDSCNDASLTALPH